jgi:hypothetical protein
MFPGPPKSKMMLPLLGCVVALICLRLVLARPVLRDTTKVVTMASPNLDKLQWETLVGCERSVVEWHVQCPTCYAVACIL